MEPVKVLAQWLVNYSLPDVGFSKRREAGRLLKDKGCQAFLEHKHWDPIADEMQVTIIGYKVEE